MATLLFHFESLSASAGPVTKLLASHRSWRLGFSVACRFGREVFGVIYVALRIAPGGLSPVRTAACLGGGSAVKATSASVWLLLAWLPPHSVNSDRTSLSVLLGPFEWSPPLEAPVARAVGRVLPP